MNIALIVAAGKGERFGSPVPKQFVEILGKPVVAWTVERFYRCEAVDWVVVVVPEGWVRRSWEILKPFKDKIVGIIEGGETRQESVKRGVFSLEGRASPEDVLLIHDGVRPAVDERVILENVEKAREKGVVVTALPMEETASVSEDGETVKEVVPRNLFYRHQTPQSFLFGIALDIYRRADGELLRRATDDVSLALALGYSVAIVRGSKSNIKITTAEDFAFAEAILRNLQGGDRQWRRS